MVVVLESTRNASTQFLILIVLISYPFMQYIKGLTESLPTVYRSFEYPIHYLSILYRLVPKCKNLNILYDH